MQICKKRLIFSKSVDNINNTIDSMHEKITKDVNIRRELYKEDLLKNGEEVKYVIKGLLWYWRIW